MSYLLRMAVRNTLRNRRRSALTLVAIVLGVGLFILTRSLIGGIERTMVGTEIDSEQAHLRVMTKGFADDEEFFPIDQGLPDVDAVAALLARGHGGALVTRRAAFAAHLSDGARGLNCRGLAVDPGDYERVIRLGGLAAPPAGAAHWMWLGADLAAAFDARPGARMSLQAKTRAGARNALTEVVVAGVVSTGHPLVDNFTLFVPPGTAAELLDVGPGYATEVLARYRSPSEADEAEAQLGAARPELVAETWREKTAYIVRFNDVRRAVFNVFTAVIMLMAAAGVANTTLMSGFERVAEIGALLALGLTRRRVLTLFVLEAGILAAFGVAVGLLLGGVPAYWLAQRGVPFPGVGEQAGTSMPVPPVLYLDPRPSTFAMAALLGAGATLLAAVYPAWRLSRTDPIYALKVEG